jgi:hypothetical protein
MARRAQVLDQADRHADGPKVVRARPGGKEDQVRERYDVANSLGQGRRRVDDQQGIAAPAELGHVVSQSLDRGLQEMGARIRPQVPPVGQAALWIDVRQRHLSNPFPLGLHAEMTRQGRLARAALARRDHDNSHGLPPSQALLRHGNAYPPLLHLGRIRTGS